jgi:hypothetical protein
VFQISDTQQKPIGSLTLRLTNKSATSCGAGKWRRIDIVENSVDSLDLEEFVIGAVRRIPAYQVNGTSLNVDLSAPICDANHFLTGQINAGVATGKLMYLNFGRAEQIGFFEAKKPD